MRAGTYEDENETECTTTASALGSFPGQDSLAETQFPVNSLGKPMIDSGAVSAGTGGSAISILLVAKRFQRKDRLREKVYKPEFVLMEVFRSEDDEAKLKEMMKEDDIAKAKQALEKRKKLAEKAAAKASYKKLKKRLKRSLRKLLF
ncbi:hypothetical protein U1Q18_000681 [Sarracenia purpurea var. burkii]